MGASYSEVFASAEACDTSEDGCEVDVWSAQAYHRSGVLVWRVPDGDEPVRAAWVPYPDDDGPTMLLNMTKEERDAIGLREVPWAALCAGLQSDEVRQHRERKDRESIRDYLERFDSKLDSILESERLRT